jgi:hypothetical protein
MCYFILCVFSSLTLFFTRCVIGFIFSFYQGCVLLSYAFFVCFTRNAFPLPMCHIPHDVISIGMCSFILCVICFTLSFGLRSFIRYGISFLLSGPPGICFYLVWTMFYFVFSIRKAFYHPICHMLYIVNSTCDVTFHAMVPGFYFIRCVSYVLYCHVHLMFYFIPRGVLCFTLHCLFGLLSSSDVSLCVIMSCPSGICYFIPCIMFSDCSVHPLTCRVDSTRRAKCAITICTKSDIVIRYAPHQIPVTSDNSC